MFRCHDEISYNKYIVYYKNKIENLYKLFVVNLIIH